MSVRRRDGNGRGKRGRGGMSDKDNEKGGEISKSDKNC